VFCFVPHRFKTRPGAAAEALSFSVIYGSEYETLDLVASNEAQYKLWTNAVSYYVQEAAKADKIELFLRQAWRKADKNGDNKLSLNEISHLLRQLNVNVHHEHLKKRFKEVAKDNFLDFAGFSEFYKHLKYRKDVKELFGTLTKTFPKVKLTAEEFKSFLISEQKLDVSDADVRFLIRLFNKQKNIKTGQGHHYQVRQGPVRRRRSPLARGLFRVPQRTGHKRAQPSARDHLPGAFKRWYDKKKKN